jgi:hypothetical protein
MREESYLEECSVCYLPSDSCSRWSGAQKDITNYNRRFEWKWAGMQTKVPRKEKRRQKTKFSNEYPVTKLNNRELTIVKFPRTCPSCSIWIGIQTDILTKGIDLIEKRAGTQIKGR